MTWKKGDRFTANVEVIKVKNGTPTVVLLDGKQYILRHESQYTGGAKK